MIYTECASGCPKTCENYDLNFNEDECKQDCTPGCVCQDGFLRNAGKNNTCTKKSECSCMYNGNFYQANDIVNIECNNW